MNATSSESEMSKASKDNVILEFVSCCPAKDNFAVEKKNSTRVTGVIFFFELVSNRSYEKVQRTKRNSFSSEESPQVGSIMGPVNTPHFIDDISNTMRKCKVHKSCCEKGWVPRYVPHCGAGIFYFQPDRSQHIQNTRHI